jgi:hypothetical protein
VTALTTTAKKTMTKTNDKTATIKNGKKYGEGLIPSLTIFFVF